MRYKYLLIPPIIIWLWTTFQAFKSGYLSPGNVQKRLFFIVHNSEALIKGMMHENDKKSNSVDSKETGRQVVIDSAPKKMTGEVSDVHKKHEDMRAPTQNKKENTRNSTILAAKEKDSTSTRNDECSKDGKKLVGPLMVDQNTVDNMEDLERKLSVQHEGWVKKGGAWAPDDCKALRKVAIILPYRNRYEQLKIFLRHLHPILKRQLVDYRIFIIEQDGDTVFNRAILFNIGFKEAQKFNRYQCFIFHDVDLLPENDHNMYSCPTSPRHMCPAVDKFHYRLPYSYIFGGVEAFWKEDFEKVNGFSNKYWGWGGEDDDLSHRCRTVGLKLTRSSMTTGRYKMLRDNHNIDGRKDPKRTRQLLNGAIERMKEDGLNSLKYDLLQMDSFLLYTRIKIAVDPAAV